METPRNRQSTPGIKGSTGEVRIFQCNQGMETSLLLVKAYGDGLYDEFRID